MKKISIVAPVHNESEIIEEFWRRLVNSLAEVEYSIEFIFVDDGSNDSSWSKIVELAKKDTRIKAIKLSRNFGHQNAVSCGLLNSTGDAVVIIDTDLQDPPEIILKFISLWESGYKNVFGKRISRHGESWFKRASAICFYRLLSKFSEVEIPRNTGDFRLIDRTIVNQLNTMKEDFRFLRGMVSWTGFKSTSVEYERDPRVKGETSYPLSKMLVLAANGLLGFSAKPLKLASYVGIAGILLSFSYAIYLIFQKIENPESSIAGFSTTMIAITTMGSIQLLTIGLIGEYIQRIFIQTKERPLYIVEEFIGG